MKISAKIDYACRALIELSLHWPNTVPLQINIIAERQKIPIKFLTHILINLKQLGYVDSVRGKNGGYLSSKAPKDIKLSDLIIRFGGLASMNKDIRNIKKVHILDAIWLELDEAIIRKLDELNFEKICDRVRSQNRTLVFDI